jgi:hypothetical protein
VSVPNLSPTTANGAVGKSQASVDNRLLGLLGPYHRHAIGTFNTCSRGSTDRFLTDTGGGYNLGGADLSRTHSPTFPNSYLHFPLRAPPGLHFNQVSVIKPKVLSFKEPMTTMWSFDHSTIYRILHLHLAIANNLSLVMGSQE